MKIRFALPLLILALSLIVFTGCSHKKVQPEVMQPPPAAEPKQIAEPQPEPEKPAVAPFSLAAIYFDYDQYDIRSDARDILSQNAKSLSEHPNATIRIEGNCDERGAEQYNLALGEKRANAAKDYLINYGIDGSRITTVSYGESRPVDRGHNEEAWAKNRRGDFVKLSD